VSSDLLPDLLSGLVAGGTLALAGATVYLGRASARVAVDAVSPRVFVSRLNVEPQPVNWPNVAGAEPQSINPGLAWSLAQHGADRLGQEASARLRNESGVSALVRPEPPEDVEISVSDWTNPQMPVTPSRQGEWYVAGPGREMVLTMYWWRPASAWAESWKTGTPGYPPRATVAISVRGATGEATDSCKISFGGYVLVPHPREDGWVIGVRDEPWRDIPGMTPPPVTSIGLMERAYSSPFRRRAPGG